MASRFALFAATIISCYSNDELAHISTARNIIFACHFALNDSADILPSEMSLVQDYNQCRRGY